jgi:hypothetical protein
MLALSNEPNRVGAFPFTCLTMTHEVTTVVQQIITKFSEAISEKDKIMVITKMVLNLMNKMAARMHR